MLKQEKLVVVGAGETARLAYEYFTHDSHYEVAGFAVEQQFLTTNDLFGLPVVPLERIEEFYDPTNCRAFVAVSSTQMNRLRTRLYQNIREKNFRAVSYISSKAFIWRDVEMGENCFILEGNVIQSGVKIGNNVVLWSGNHIGHQSRIRDNCFISSHVVISGFCDVGENCFFGVNSCIGNNLTIAADCLIAAGAVVGTNTEEGKIYRGNPASAARLGSLEFSKVEATKC